MSSIQERLQLKRIPLDTWSVREQLCLASAVLRSGDQNWTSVSRALKTVADTNRPADWYSLKSCAAQYGALLEHVETPKRKKRSSEGAVETPQESILKRLTQERIAELQKSISDLTHHHQVVKTEIVELQNPVTSEERVKEIWSGIEAAKRARDREQAKRAAWLKEREEKRTIAERTWRPTPGGDPPATTPSPSAMPPASPLLTSLLKSSPVVTTPQLMSHPANLVETISPSAGAPTLSMLLDKPVPVSPVTTPSQETKNAAIEHIKSQFLQLEQQLKASTTCSSPVSMVPSVAPPTPIVDKVDIDDIEIKAEDVYAFSDIDIDIPPVSSIHKTQMARSLEKVVYKKDDSDIPTSGGDTSRDESMQPPEEINVVPTDAEIQPDFSDINVQEELPPHVTPEEMEEPQRPLLAPEEVTVKVAFPEVKFPTPEIKVINQEETKTKEEPKEVELPKENVEVRYERNENTFFESAPIIPKEEEIVEPDVAVPDVAVPDVAVPDAAEPDVAVPDAAVLDVAVPDAAVPEEPAAPQVEPPSPEDTQPPIEDAIEEKPQVLETPALIEEAPKESAITPITEVTKDGVTEDATEEVPERTEPAESVGDATPAEDVQTEEIKDIKKEKEDEVEEASNVNEVAQESASQAVIPETAVVKVEKLMPLVKLMPEEAHTETDDDTPMELSREEEKDGKKKRDYSRKKKSDSRRWSGSESAPESPAGTETDKNHKLWKRSVMLVHSRLCAHKYASLFLRPITNEQAPGYSLTVRRPMDLTTIKKNIDAGVIRTTAEFQRDVLLMLSNALMYNSTRHRVYEMAKEMHLEAEAQLGMLLQAQAHSGLSAAALPRCNKRRSVQVAMHAAPTKRRHH